MAELQPRANSSAVKVTRVKRQKIKAFLKWCKDGGIRTPYLYFETMGNSEYRTLKAKKDLAKGDLLLTVPKSMMLRAEGEDPVKDVLNTSCIPLIKALIRERANPQSKWKPYIDILPESFEELPLFWDDKENKLKGTTAWVRLQKLQEAFEKDRLTEAMAECQCEDLDTFLWAFFVVTTRSFALIGNITLIPMLDIINHRSNAHIEKRLWDCTFKCKEQHDLEQMHTFTSDFFCDSCDEMQALGTVMMHCYVCEYDMCPKCALRSRDYYMEGNQLVETARESFKKDEEVFQSYGEYSNSELLVNYGFALEVNPLKDTLISIRLNPEQQLYREKASILQKLEEKKESSSVHPTETGGVFEQSFVFSTAYCLSQECFSFVRFLACSTSEELNSIDLDFLRSGGLAPLSINNEIISLQLLHDAAAERLSSLGNLEELANSEEFSNERNLYLVRRDDRLALRALIDLSITYKEVLERGSVENENPSEFGLAYTYFHAVVVPLISGVVGSNNAT